MKNLLFIKTSFSSKFYYKIAEEVVIHELDLTERFCSYIGLSMLENIHSLDRIIYCDEFYVSNFLSDYANVDIETYQSILTQWEMIQYELLQTIPQNRKTYYEIIFPLKYIYWLLNHKEPLYNKIGNAITKNNGIILIPSEKMYNEIVSDILYYIKDYMMRNHMLIFSYIVFSDATYLDKFVRLFAVQNPDIICLSMEDYLPRHILDLNTTVLEFRAKKNEAVRRKEFELAVAQREEEKKYMNLLMREREEWEKGIQHQILELNNTDLKLHKIRAKKEETVREKNELAAAQREEWEKDKILFIPLVGFSKLENNHYIRLFDYDINWEYSFCNYFAYELIKDIKFDSRYDKSELAYLLLDFSSINIEAYHCIIFQWKAIVEMLLHEEGAFDNVFEILMPDEYVDWLLNSNNELYRKVGEKISISNKIQLSANELYEVFICRFISKLEQYISANKYKFNFIVFEAENLDFTSRVVKMIRNIDDRILPLKYLLWKDVKYVDCDFLVNETSFTMVYINGGPKLNDYYIGRFPVTQKLWNAVMGKGNNHSSCKGENLPVDRAYIWECNEFIHRISQITGKHFKLPSKEEWIYAAKGGSKSKGYHYAGGNNIDTVAWYAGNSGGHLHEVGLKLPNELGIYDMNGNVSEFCDDDYSRGGSFNSTFVNGEDAVVEMKELILCSMPLIMPLFPVVALEKREEFRRTKLEGGNGGFRLVLSL